LITARLGWNLAAKFMEFQEHHGRREFAPTSDQARRKAGDVMEDVGRGAAYGIRAELFPVEATSRAERASLFAEALSPRRNIFGLLAWTRRLHVMSWSKNRN